jgi:hypothetical protein
MIYGLYLKPWGPSYITAVFKRRDTMYRVALSGMYPESGHTAENVTKGVADGYRILYSMYIQLYHWGRGVSVCHYGMH